MKAHQWVAILFFGAASAYATDKLFPTNEARDVSVHYRQDGRAVHVTLSNESTYVITSATVECWHGGVTSNYGCKPKNPRDCDIYFTEKYNPNFNELRLIPGSSKEAYFEAKDKVSACVVIEVRGREKRLFELF